MWQLFLPQGTQLKSGTVCTVLLGTQFYAFQIQNQKRFLGIAALGVRVDRSSERRFGLRVIESKAEVTWYYETVANHSQATPSANDSRRFAGANAIMVQLLVVAPCTIVQSQEFLQGTSDVRPLCVVEAPPPADLLTELLTSRKSRFANYDANMFAS